MQTFRENRASLLLAVALNLAGSATMMYAQQPAVVDSTILKKAGTGADPLPGSWLTYGKSQSETRYTR